MAYHVAFPWPLGFAEQAAFSEMFQLMFFRIRARATVSGINTFVIFFNCFS